MSSSLSNLVSILSERVIELNVTIGTMIKNVKLVELHTKYATVFFEYTNFKDDLIEWKCLCYKKNYQQKC